MSFALGFAPDAFSQWRELGFELQERVLDELDNLAANPPLSLTDPVVRDFSHQSGDILHYIVIRATIDLAARVVTLIGIFHSSSSDN